MRSLETDEISILINFEWPTMGSVEIRKFRGQAAASLLCSDKISKLDTSRL
jgi:hypothetical protein